MLQVGRLIRDSPVRWEAAYKAFLAATETTRPRAYLEFLEDNIPIPTPRQEGAAVRVLSIGSGSGEVDSAILRKILQRQSSVYNRVVEPSGEMLKDFKALVQHDTSLGAVKFDWRQQTAEEYFSQSDGTKFDLAHAVHALYFVDDHDATLRNMWEQLDEEGHLFVLALTGINYVITDEQEQYVNVAECFKEHSEAGRLLLDFLTQTSNVSAHPEMRSKVLEYFLRNSSSVDDKILFSTANAAIIARKSTQK
ncbi:PREDICTED: histamine N-methyltransferase-like [Branchiostoma belcheri]|uniref:Histamine N-methyltransferase-like n=1 Tax=Branchiostoma belcheri TaxID=7741 RepID=A0A6P4ZT40_BRABE|nr:PREDICTED: histamine N-methyltransferase-like [Branchiostoma belcheri]